MTSSIVIDAGSATTPGQPPQHGTRQTRDRVARPVSFGGVLKSERIKLTSLRSIKITLIITVLFGIALSAAIAFFFSNELRNTSADGAPSFLTTDAAGLQSYLLIIATFATPFLALVFGVLGVFAISSEYSSGMILSTLTAVPKRTPVFFGKALVLAAVAAIGALVLVGGSLAVAVLCYPSAAAQLGSGIVVSGALGTIAYLVLISLFAYGVAALLRSTAGGIAVVAGVTFVLPIAFQLLAMTGWEWVAAVTPYLPAQLGSLLSQGVVEVSAGPNFWVALAAMVGWVAVVALPAAVLFTRRDAR